MKQFIITGASKGLGEGIAMALLHEDHHILCIARSESAELKSMAAARNCQLEFFLFDLAVSYDIKALCEKVFDRIDTKNTTGIYLVNNAGVINPIGRTESCPPDDVEQHIRINLLAPMLLTSEFIGRFKSLPVQKRIINISSGAAKFPYYGWSAYCTAKAGLDMHTRCVAVEQEMETHPVEIMAVAPGIIDTAMQIAVRSTTEEQFIHKEKFVKYKESGQLIPPILAGKRIAGLIASDDFKNGGVIDMRDSQ